MQDLTNKIALEWLNAHSGIIYNSWGFIKMVETLRISYNVNTEQLLPLFKEWRANELKQLAKRKNELSRNYSALGIDY